MFKRHALTTKPKGRSPSCGLNGSARPQLLVVGVVAIIIGSFILYRSHHLPPSPKSLTPEASQTASNNDPVRPLPQTNRASTTATHSQPAHPASALNERDQARRLLDQIFNTSGKDGELTRDQVKSINKSLQELATVGPGAAAVIREFLDRDLDLPLPKSASDTDKAAYSSVRIALFDVLKDIGGPEGTDSLLHVLGTTADPLEIAALARNIEQLAPEEHRAEILTATRESLDHALHSPNPPEDAAPLFQVMQRYGDPSVIPDLEKALPKWDYYAALSLISLPDGQGIPSLVRQLDDPAAIASSQKDVALQVLSQVAFQDNNARDAILARAKSNDISDQAWDAVAKTLGGLHFEIGNPGSEGAASQRASIELPKYKVGTDQTLFSTPTTPSFLEEQIPARLDMIDQLLAATQNPVARDALEKARTSLQGKAVAATIRPE
jgi:hypothetical protein